jgi:hypothetical protein
MLQPNVIASYATVSTFAACILGAGFMVRFFVAMAGEKRKIRHGNRRKMVEPGTHLATGVLGIANVFAVTHHIVPVSNQPYVVAKTARQGKADSVGGRAYRLG